MAKKAKTNREIIDELIHHLELGKPILNRKRKPISGRTVKKYRVWLKKINLWFKLKPFHELTERDIDTFRTNLKNDKIRDLGGDPYKPSTKADIEEKFLKTLLNYIGKPQYAMFISSFDDRVELPALSKEEVETMISSAQFRDKFILQILFDGGFRADELLNVKFKDVYDQYLESDGYYQIRITKSKTYARTVGLTLPQSTELIKLWLERNKDKVGTSQPLIDISYFTLHKLVRRAGERFLKRRISPHILRHSSASYYCHYLSRYQMCKRFGWSMSSDMPARYIDRENVEDKKINDQVVKEESLSVHKELNSVREKLNVKNDELASMQKRMDEMQEQFSEVMGVLKDVSKLPDKIIKYPKGYDSKKKTLFSKLLNEDF